MSELYCKQDFKEKQLSLASCYFITQLTSSFSCGLGMLYAVLQFSVFNVF